MILVGMAFGVVGLLIWLSCSVRSQSYQEYREFRDDLAIASLRSLPSRSAKKERVRVCGCGRRLFDDR